MRLAKTLRTHQSLKEIGDQRRNKLITALEEKKKVHDQGTLFEAKKKATHCGRCGHTHVKGTPCPRPFKEGAKPDYLDLDQDNDTAEPMKKAAKDAKLKDKGAHKIKEDDSKDKVDTITMDIPLFLRMLEYSREDASEDMDLHDVTEKANALSREKETLTMEDYEAIIGREVSEVVVTDDAEKAEDIANRTGEEVKVVKKGTLKEGREYDYEGKMAQSQLISIVKNARDLFNMIGGDDQLKSWVQSKLTKAEDYLDSVRTYLEGESLTSTAPVVVEEAKVRDEEGTNLNVGDVVKAGDGKIYQIIFSYSENKPFLVPFDLKRRKPTSLRTKVYFDSEDLIAKKLNKVMDYSATKGGFMK